MTPGAAEHRPLAPWWDCAACGQLWPCPAERERLQREFAGRPDLLGKHLQQQMEQAARYVASPKELHERFLVWAPGVLAPAPPTESADRGRPPVAGAGTPPALGAAPGLGAAQ